MPSRGYTAIPPLPLAERDSEPKSPGSPASPSSPAWSAEALPFHAERKPGGPARRKRWWLAVSALAVVGLVVGSQGLSVARPGVSRWTGASGPDASELSKADVPAPIPVTDILEGDLNGIEVAEEEVSCLAGFCGGEGGRAPGCMRGGREWASLGWSGPVGFCLFAWLD